jgi:hypothetical protein
MSLFPPPPRRADPGDHRIPADLLLGHLILLPNLSGLEDQGQVIDVAVHVGTLGAVILYFWRDVKLGLSGIPRMLTGRIDTPDRSSPSCWPSPRSR